MPKCPPLFLYFPLILDLRHSFARLNFLIFLLLFFLLLTGGGRGNRAAAIARKLPDLNWQSSNIIFDMSNTEHVKRVNLLDRITLLCPSPVTLANEYEHSKLFMVSRDSYERCFLNGGERQLGVCSSPDRQSSITLVFREFSPLPSAFTFKPGHSYFVITTSNGTLNGLNNTQGGLCSTRNMRLKFDVLPSISSNENDLLDNHHHQQQLIISSSEQQKQHNSSNNQTIHHRHTKHHPHPHHHHHHKSKEENPNPQENSKELLPTSSEHPPFLYVIHTDNDDKQSKIIFGAEEGGGISSNVLEQENYENGNLENLDLTTIFMNIWNHHQINLKYLGIC